jgi:hypothetical protein
MSFRTLHSFTVTLDKEVEETSRREEGGQTITTTSKVTKAVPVTILLKEPSRREKQELALFQQVTYNKAIELGLLPKLIMQQKLGKDGATNPLSREEDANLRAMNARLLELSNDFAQLGSSETTVEDKESIKERKERLLVEYMALQSKVIDLNAAYQSVYDHTAERYTENETLLWLTLFLSFVNEPGSGDSVPRPLFQGSDYAAKKDKQGDLEDGKDPLYTKAIEKLPYLWMLYLYGRASTPEEFARVEEEFKRQAEAEAKIKAEADAKAADDEKKAKEADAAEPAAP